MVRLVVDSEGLHKNAGSTKLPLQKRLRIDMAALRQGLKRGEFVITWVPSKANLADPMTKADDRSHSDFRTPKKEMKSVLLDAFRSNCTNLKGIRQVTKTKEDVRNY